MPGRRAELPQIRALDGLRGLAVLGILLFHAGGLVGGWLGVDVFFVLSGFLITSLLLSEQESAGDISLVAFWGRRARRLLPALLVALLGVCVYAALFARPEDLARIRSDALATLLYVQNWHAIAAGHDYWEMFRRPSPLDHTWSLAIEEQFYLLWPPVVVLLLRRASVRRLAVVAAALALLSAGWMAACYDPGRGTARVYFGTDTRAFATLAGAALAALLRGRLRRWPGPHDRRADAAAVVCLLALVAASLVLDGSAPLAYRGGIFGVVLVSAVVVAGVVLAPRGLASRVLCAAPLRWLGLVSYGVYLWHWPVYLVLTPERTGLAGPSLTALRIAATLLPAIVSYVALEQPVRRRRWPARRPRATGLAAATGVAACVWLATWAPPTRDLRSAGGEAHGADLLLIGDSMAYQLQAAFVEEAQRRGLRAAAMASEGCVALRSQAIRFLSGQVFDLAPCLRFREGWISWVARYRPEVVLLLEGWSGEGEKQVGGRWTHPCEEDFDRAYAADLGDLVRRFETAGATTALALLPPPSVPDLSPNYAGNWGGTRDEELETLFRERVACQNRVRAEVARHTGARLLDLESEVCPDGRCLRDKAGARLRPDGVHFQGDGAAWASRWLLDGLQQGTEP